MDSGVFASGQDGALLTFAADRGVSGSFSFSLEMDDGKQQNVYVPGLEHARRPLLVDPRPSPP